MSLSLYVHWPFCKSKCPYCDFNSHVREGVDEDRWRKALLTELDFYLDQFGDKNIATIFFGGGTPSLMQPDTVAAIIDAALNNKETGKESELALSSAICASQEARTGAFEITLEANPTSSEAVKFEQFRKSGINRLSMGIQSLDDNRLKFLGRQHSAAEAMEAFVAAKNIFPRTSFDLIYATPGQSIAEWEKELSQALEYDPGHISLYQLTIEPGTAFHALHKDGRLNLPHEELAEEFYNLTGQITAVAGYNDYEVSNYARSGNECRHNMAYWQSGDFIGIGPGAHGRFNIGSDRFSTMNIKSPERWLTAVEKNGHGIEEKISLTRREQGEEVLLMGLRMSKGINLEFFRQRGGIDLATALPRWIDGGFVEIKDNHLHATASGRLLLNSLISGIAGDLWP